MNFSAPLAVHRILRNLFIMSQELVIAVLFIAALAYLGYIIYQSFKERTGCSSGCGSCGIDFSEIRKHLEKDALK